MSMMSKISSYLRGVTVLLSDVAVCCLTVGLIPLLTKWELYIALPVWIGFLCLLFLADDMMAAFGVPVNVYLIGNAAAIAAGTYFTLRYSWSVPESADIRVLLAFGVIGTGIHGAVSAYRLPGSNGILRYVDCLIVLLAFYLYVVYSTGVSGNPEFIPVALAAMALDLLMVNHLRTGEEGRSVIHGAGAGGKLALMLVLAGCLAVTGAIVGLASGQVHSIVDIALVIMAYLWKIVEVVFGIIGKVLSGIILFIVMLMPATPGAVKENMAASAQESAEEVLEAAGNVIPEWVFFAVLGAGALALAGWIMYQLRHTRLRRRAARRNRRRMVRKSYLLPALLELCRRLKEKLAFEWAYRRCRTTPQGLLVLAERIGRQKKVGRQVYESPGEYLRRLDLVLRAQQAAAGGSTETGGVPAAGQSGEGCSLAELGRLLDRIYYADQPCELTQEEYRNYVRLIRAVR